MGKINDILYTEQGSLTALSVSTAKSGMREERIEYMTKVVLCVAKLLRLPLDKTIKKEIQEIKKEEKEFE